MANLLEVIMYLKSNRIYLPDNIIFSGYLKIENGKITNILKVIENQHDVVDYGDKIIIPGFMDVHIHGYGTGSYVYSNTEKDIIEMSKCLPKIGITSYLATTCCDEFGFLKDAVRNCCSVLNKGHVEGAECMGLHLEGPFINPEYKGMMKDEYILKPSIDTLKELLSCSIKGNEVKLMTIAAELDEDFKVIDWCKKHHIQIQCGHSAATFDTMTKMREHGVHAVTHMFSGMKGMHHRELGVVGSALYYDDINCEFCKQTGMTVKKEAFELVWRIKGPEKISMCTDCAGLANVREPRYHYIRKQTFIPDGDNLIIRNDDGTEKILNRRNYDDVKDLEMGYLDSIKNVIEYVHPTIHEIMKITSENQAKHIGVFDRKGSIEVGKDADLLVLTDDFDLVDVYCLGIKQDIA